MGGRIQKPFRVRWKGASTRRHFPGSTFVTVSINRYSFGTAFRIYLFNVAKSIQTLTRQQLQTRTDSSMAIDVKLFIELPVSLAISPSPTVQYEFKISFHAPDDSPAEKKNHSVYKGTLSIWLTRFAEASPSSAPPKKIRNSNNATRT